MFAGEADGNFFVVQSGRLNVYITEPDGGAISLKIVHAGDSIASLCALWRSTLRLPDFHTPRRVEKDIRRAHVQHELKQPTDGRQFQPYRGNTRALSQSSFDVIVDHWS